MVDAPCAATGTLRRHPDIAWLKQEADLHRADRVAAASGDPRVVVAEARRNDGFLHLFDGTRRRREAIAALLASDSSLKRVPIEASEIGGLPDLITAEGDLRSLPCHLPHEDPRLGGLDGFFAARLIKSR